MQPTQLHCRARVKSPRYLPRLLQLTLQKKKKQIFFAYLSNIIFIYLQNIELLSQDYLENFLDKYLFFYLTYSNYRTSRKLPEFVL